MAGRSQLRAGFCFPTSSAVIFYALRSSVSFGLYGSLDAQRIDNTL
jgi:hypothetical protein